MTPARLHTFTNDGFTFEVIDEGPLDGPVIIALHGFPERAEGYRAMIPTIRCVRQCGRWPVCSPV